MTDITVRGAGVFGLSIAWACVQRGARVQVVDPGGPGAGASGGIVGALAPHVPENWNPKKAFQLDSLLMAERFWAEVAQTGGKTSGYVRSGRLQPVPDEAALAMARARAASASDLWGGAARWEVIRAEGGWAPNSPSGWLIRDTLSAHIHPRQACEALVAALKAQGVTVLPDAPDRGAVIWATGAHGLQDLGASLGVVIGQGIKGQAALLGLDRSGEPQLFAGGVHVVPHLDGTVAVGSTTEREFDDPFSTDRQLDDVVAAARAALPEMANAPVIRRWAGLRPRSRSRAPVLGPWPGRRGHFIANGGFKIGFGMAPKVAQVMADLVLDAVDQIPQGFRVEDNLPKGQ